MTRRALFLFSTDEMNGAERVTRALAQESAKCGSFDHVHCFVLRGPKTGTLDELLATRKVSLHYTNSTSQLGGAIHCVALATKMRFDLVFSSHIALNALCSLLRRLWLLRARKLVARESTMSFERDFGFRTRLVRAIYLFYGSQDLIVCQTDRMRSSLCRHVERLAPKCIVLQNPIELERIRANSEMRPPAVFEALPADRRKIVWCGRLIDVKRPLLALETLRSLHDGGDKDVHLVMLGAGPLLHEMKTEAARLGVSEFVTLVGYTVNPASIMARCDVGLVTSTVEGFPNVVMEMLATGLRGVVTTDCAGGLDSIARVTVVDSTAHSLAAALRPLLGNNENKYCRAMPDFCTPRVYLREIGVN